MSPPPLPRPGSLGAWKLAVRPPTLAAGWSPVVLGTALAAWTLRGNLTFAGWATAICALTVAILIQIGTNFINDWADFRKGADTPDRVGPPRVCALGLLSPNVVLTAAIVVFTLAGLIGIAIAIATDPIPVCVVGGICIIMGFAYTAGPAPIAYLGLGEIFTFTFFGLVATTGTYAVVTYVGAEFRLGAIGAPGFARSGVSLGALAAQPAPLLAGAALGFLSAALLAVNNLRDIDTDITAGKRTLATRLGRDGTKNEIRLLFILAYLCLTAMALLSSPFALFGLLGGYGALQAWGPIRDDTGNNPRALIASLRGIARTEAVTAVLAAFGLAIGILLT